MNTMPRASLRFSPYAWAKLQHALKTINTEVGMFGITDKEDPLCVLDVSILPQEVSSASIEFSEEGLASFYEDCIDEGLLPEQYSRIWIHTHPSGVYSPSSVDEKTFEDIFGNCDWAVMYIVTKDNREYCALQYNRVPKHRVELGKAIVDFSIPFPASNIFNWEKEIKDNVKKKVFENKFKTKTSGSKDYPFHISTKEKTMKAKAFKGQVEKFYSLTKEEEELYGVGFWEEDFEEYKDDLPDYWKDV